MRCPTALPVRTASITSPLTVPTPVPLLSSAKAEDAEVAAVALSEARRGLDAAKGEAEDWKERWVGSPHTYSHRALRVEDDLSALRERSRALLEEAELKAERLQAAARRQLQQAKAAVSQGGPVADAQPPPLQGTGRVQSGSGGSRAVSDLVGSGSGGTLSPAQVLELQRMVVQLREAHEDSERTHRLRDQTEMALKEEVAKQQVGGQMHYIHYIIIFYFSSHNLVIMHQWIDELHDH